MPGAIEKGGAACRPGRRTFVLENLIVSVNVVFPLFALMAVGFLLNRIGLLDGRTAEKMNTVTFKAFLPVLIFYNIYRTDVGEIFDRTLVFSDAGLGIVLTYSDGKLTLGANQYLTGTGSFILESEDGTEVLIVEVYDRVVSIVEEVAP